MNKRETLQALRNLASKDIASTAQKRGLDAHQVLGVPTKELRKLANSLGKTHPQIDQLAHGLWQETIHEAKMLAILMHARRPVDSALCRRWVQELDSWSLCDQFAKTMVAPSGEAWSLVTEWCSTNSLYVRRAGFATLANVCMKTHQLESEEIDVSIELIRAYSVDDRQHAKQAVCWALRELGKIDHTTHEQASQLALELADESDPSRTWVGRCAYRELEQLVSVPERRRLIAASSKTAQAHRNRASK